MSLLHDILKLKTAVSVIFCYARMIVSAYLTTIKSFKLVNEAVLTLNDAFVNCVVFQKARELHREHQALEQLEADRACVAEHLQCHGNGKPVDAHRRQEALQHYISCREERVQDFIQALKQKRDSYFNDLWSGEVLP